MVPHIREHNGACTHGSGAPACCSAEARAASVPTFRTGRSYKVQGMDCAGEVAVLKQAVGPLVGGVDRLAFDVLNGRMTVANNARDVPEKAIVGAVAATGMSAVPWAARTTKERTDDHRRQQALFTTTSGVCVLIGLSLHIVLAGGFAEAWKSRPILPQSWRAGGSWSSRRGMRCATCVPT
jgi:Cd2+/Zn2+-exporting ATPase